MQGISIHSEILRAGLMKKIENLTRRLTFANSTILKVKLYFMRDGSPEKGDKREFGSVNPDYSEAAPATVCGSDASVNHWETGRKMYCVNPQARRPAIA